MPDSRPEVAATGAAPDPYAVLRSRRYIGLLVIAAILGAPVAAAAFWFLKLLSLVQAWVYKDVPAGLGLGGATWWPGRRCSSPPTASCCVPATVPSGRRRLTSSSSSSAC